MSIIGAYLEVCSKLTQEQFCEQSSHPLLLHCMQDGILLPTVATRGVTMDRLILAGALGARGPGVPTKEEAYSIFVLQPKTPQDRRLTIGCSKTCDVQINDESVSGVHAILEHAGESYWIRDNNSAAGTQVNGELVEVKLPRELSSGDRVTLGYVDLIFLLPGDFYQFVRRFFGVQPA